MGINKPVEAWIRDDDRLYIGFPEGKPPFAGVQATTRAREVLDEYGYEIEPSYIEIREHKSELWVNPSVYSLEHWSDAEVSEQPVPRWVEVWVVNIAEIDKHRDCE